MGTLWAKGKAQLQITSQNLLINLLKELKVAIICIIWPLQLPQDKEGKVSLYLVHHNLQNIKMEIQSFIIKRSLWEFKITKRIIQLGSKLKRLRLPSKADFWTELLVHQWEIRTILQKIFRSENNFRTQLVLLTSQPSMFMKSILKSRQLNYKICLLAWQQAVKMDLPKKAPPEQLVLPIPLLTPILVLVALKEALKTKLITISTSLQEIQFQSQWGRKLLEALQPPSNFCKIMWINLVDLMKNKLKLPVA